MRWMTACVIALAGCAAANADTVTAQYSSSLGRGVDIVRNGNPASPQTVLFSWARVDSPGPGVDTSVPLNFSTYCVELDQQISPGTPYTYDVAIFAAAGYSSFQELCFERLWGAFFALVDTDVESAAFQLATWEIRYDGTDLATGTFTASAPADSLALAQAWLAVIADPGYAGPVQQLVVLTSPTAQDLIVVPGPGSLALLGLGGFVAVRRKRS